MTSRQDAEAPPPEAYSRVTNAKRFSRIANAVVGGRFVETASVPLFRRAMITHEYTYDDGGGSGGGQYLTRARARVLTRGKPRRVEWLPWTKRPRV